MTPPYGRDSLRDTVLDIARYTGVAWVDGSCGLGWFENRDGKRSGILCLRALQYEPDAKQTVLAAVRQVAPEEPPEPKPAPCAKTGLRRWKLETTVERVPSDVDLSVRHRQDSAMRSHPEGEWVRYVDAAAALSDMEARIPEVRIARLEKALGLVSRGMCPECGVIVDGSLPSPDLPRIAGLEMRAAGIDPETGHLLTCSRRNQP